MQRNSLKPVQIYLLVELRLQKCYKFSGWNERSTKYNKLFRCKSWDKHASRSALLLGRDSWVFRGNSAIVLRTRKIDENDSGFRVIFIEGANVATMHSYMLCFYILQPVFNFLQPDTIIQWYMMNCILSVNCIRLCSKCLNVKKFTIL